MAPRDAQDAQHAPSVHGTRSTTRSTTSKPHPALTSRSVTAFRSRSASAGQSRTAAPENAPARTPGDHSDAHLRLDLYPGFGVTLAIPAAPNRSICVRSDALRGHSRHEVGLPP